MRYIIVSHSLNTDRSHSTEPLTLEEAIDYFGYTLEVGMAYQHEKGNKKIDRHPKTIASLIKNLTNASGNRAANGQGLKFYEYNKVA